jgi:hypothetical protein
MAVNKPTILVVKIRDLKHMLHEWKLYPSIIFGIRKLDKILRLQINGNAFGFHGLWYLLIDAPYWNINVLNCDDDNDTDVLIGLGFQQVTNLHYFMEWGHQTYLTDPKKKSPYMLICGDGSCVYRYCNLS